MAEVGVKWNMELIKVQADAHGGGFLIVAVKDVPVGTWIASIPKSACLTMLNSEIRDILEEEQLGGGLALVISVWFERGLGSASRWKGYFDFIPKREDLPIFWKPEEVSLLKGTELGERTMADKQDVVDDFNVHVLPLLEKYPDRFAAMKDKGVEDFLESASLVASRAFAVDEMHGDGMMPLADVFNHKVSLVRLSDEYQINGAEDDTSSDDGDNYANDSDDVNIDEDIEEEGEHKNGRSKAAEDDSMSAQVNAGLHSEESDKNDAPVLCRPPSNTFNFPSIQDNNEKLEIFGMKEVNGLPLRLHMAVIEDDTHDSLQIIAVSDLKRNCEIFNTYGELGNAELLKKYGFCLKENPFSEVKLNKGVVLSSFKALFSLSNKRKRSAARITFERCIYILKEQTDLLEEEDEPFLLYPGAYINLSLFAFIRLMTAFACQDFQSEERISVEAALEFVQDIFSEGIPVHLNAIVDGLSDIGCDSFELTNAWKSCLKGALLARLQQYPMSMEQAQQELEGLEDTSATGFSQTESILKHQGRKRAALLLQITELSILSTAIKACNEVVNPAV